MHDPDADRSLYLAPTRFLDSDHPAYPSHRGEHLLAQQGAPQKSKRVPTSRRRGGSDAVAWPKNGEVCTPR